MNATCGANAFYIGSRSLSLRTVAFARERFPDLDQFHSRVLKLNGLTLPWAGKVFVNPPYGRAIPTWANKTILEYESLRAREILLLLPNRPGTQWYLSLCPYSRVNITGRLNFLDGNGIEQESAPFPSVLFYFGSRQQTFITHWEKWGEVIIKKKPKFDKKEYQREHMRLRRQKMKKYKSKDI